MDLFPIFIHALMITVLVFVMMLPLLSYSLKDSVLIKMFNIIFGLLSGGILFAFGV